MEERRPWENPPVFSGQSSSLSAASCYSREKIMSSMRRAALAT